MSNVGDSALPSSPRRQTFASPPARPVTFYYTSSNSPSAASFPARTPLKPRPKSTKLSLADLSYDSLYFNKASLEQIKKEHRPRARLAYFLTYAFAALGVVFSFLQCYLRYTTTPLLTDKDLCRVVLDEDFTPSFAGEDDAAINVRIFGNSSTDQRGLFFRQVDMSGFGNGEFEMTTASPQNSFVSNGMLYIVPTLTTDTGGVSEAQLLNGSVYNITGCTYNITQESSYTGSTATSAGSSTGSSSEAQNTFDLQAYLSACSAVSNATTGKIINPIQSARLSTRTSASMKYGKVSVRAKIPSGDWLWPAIWMLPIDETYGSWPLSGEIDIMEARGNGRSYPKQGADYVRSSLNWGPTTFLNAVSKTYGWWKLRRGTYADDFHTYEMEWTDGWIRTYVDSRLHHTLDLRMKKPKDPSHPSYFWHLGDFPSVVQNGSQAVVLADPWINGTKAAPFDQPFYLILNVAVGGTNGWFPDGSEKPWLDGSQTAMRDFWNAKQLWYPTWPTDVKDRALVIDKVQMWELCQ